MTAPKPALVADDADWVPRYLQHLAVQRRLSPRTLALYAAHLQVLQQHAAAEGLTLAQVHPAHVRRWLAQLHAAGRQPRGLALMLSSWRGFYRWVGRQGWMDAHPVTGVRAPKASRALPKALSVEQALQLVQSASGEPQDEPLRLRDRAMAELLYSSGLRLGELLGLDIHPSPSARGWVDLDSAEVHVCGKGGKWRSVPVGVAAQAALRDWLQARAAWLGAAASQPALFVGARGARLTPQVARRALAALARQAGLAIHVHPHMLRHSCASHVLQSSGDLRGVQELLGHASIASTQLYTRLDFQHLSRVYEAAHPRAQHRASSPAPQPPAAACGKPRAGQGQPNS
ncbi:Tyrosine recombinase XerC [Tepidimonas alkaliphilus]|uniref:Tyrosine recombinase XerC n=1 Tax=Tepidimonas alkaliphilus TaxID=2588942 RepID=A0A554W779_9BURK|nr:tyrosine-type recombinase/integrase [Tepidimonas alkaliphilus]TSE19437.1 Tyrosine recombinase XerC [Tepidimonas alkaliphilus]